MAFSVDRENEITKTCAIFGTRFCDYLKTLRPKLTQEEGFIMGVGAKMFTIAGPVIVYGVAASVVYGFIYWITTLF